MKSDSVKIGAIWLVIILALVFFGGDGCEKDDHDSYTYEEYVEDYNSKTVYVSKYGKIHKNRHCSGMMYYDVMTYGEAIEQGYEKCANCY